MCCMRGRNWNESVGVVYWSAGSGSGSGSDRARSESGSISAGSGAGSGSAFYGSGYGSGSVHVDSQGHWGCNTAPLSSNERIINAVQRRPFGGVRPFVICPLSGPLLGPSLGPAWSPVAVTSICLPGSRLIVSEPKRQGGSLPGAANGLRD
jgi:hypothetical protein